MISCTRLATSSDSVLIASFPLHQPSMSQSCPGLQQCSHEQARSACRQYNKSVVQVKAT